MNCQYFPKAAWKSGKFLLLLAVLALSLALLWDQPQTTADTHKSDTTATLSETGNPFGVHIRVAWVQDMGDGRDVDTKGDNLRLMVLDSADGTGERELLGKGNYTKPLITPRGDRVVYSNLIQKKIYVVNWDGSGKQELFGGYALALWQDPKDGREWIYYGFAEMQYGGFTCPAVYRTPLNRPGAGELVWNKAPVNVDSFQLSTDGQIAGGNFPWPEGGVAYLPNKELKIFTKGCWTALTTVKGNPLYWIFDGAHRNLTIFDLQSNKKWQVKINSAPGISGYEVYHPRWSNDPWIMAMTGPYKVGSGSNRILAGGREVEIYIGRFNSEFSMIESWWRVTKNDRADFFPDVWVKAVQKDKLSTKKGSGANLASTKQSGDSTAAGIAGDSRQLSPVRTSPPDKTLKQLIVEARLTDLSVTPAPRDIAPYRKALLVNGYEVVRVVSGSYRPKKIMVAHWVIEEGRILAEAKRAKGKTYRMVLERFDDHPELEGERLIMDSDEFKLPLFYELRK
ncbi:MAG: hypothetical protein AB1558_01875 [Thermodesulfobacteriota bacterium]